MKMDEIPHILSHKKQMEWYQGDWSHVLILTTDLSLDPEAGDYDDPSLQKMLNDISVALKARKTGFHKIKLEEA